MYSLCKSTCRTSTLDKEAQSALADEQALIMYSGKRQNGRVRTSQTQPFCLMPEARGNKIYLSANFLATKPRAKSEIPIKAYVDKAPVLGNSEGVMLP